MGNQRWMARVMGLVFITFFATFSLAQTVDRLGVIGDSASDEYIEQTFDYARSWTELLVDERGLSLGPTAAQAGQPGGTWGEPRRTGYEDNWARSGATTLLARIYGQHTGVADGAVNRGVSHVVLYIGANDFSPWASPYPYDQIYHGNWSQVQIETWIDSRIANLEILLDVVEPTGASLVILNTFDLSVCPDIHQGGYPDPVRREAAAMAVDQFGAEIRNLARARAAVFLDTFDLARAIFGTNLAPHSILLVGNVAIDLDDTDLPGGGSPMAAFVHDGIHSNTVLQSIWANAVITALNLGYDTQIVPLSEQEMLAAAGIAYGGIDTLEQEIGPLEAFVTVFPDPPVASFTFDPADPTTGSAVTFTDTSTGTVASWAWDFGDGGSSTERNPSHTFTCAGTFTVTLTATNAGGSSDASQDVIVTGGATLTESYYIAAAALAAGLEGAFFQTDVDINNSGATGACYALVWLPRGGNNSTPTQSATFTLAAGASIRYENVLSAVFGLEPDVAGALAVLSNSGELKIMSRTYNLPTAKVAGTFGQALPGVPAGDLITQNEVKRIIFMSETDDLRANLGCVNGVNDNVPIDITTYDETGAMLETQRMSLGPWSNNQINQIFADFAPTNGYADVTSIKANAGYYCYGSVLDNGSNDPTSILPTEYGADAPFVNYYIPAAALAAGLEGAFFQTDVDINNADAEMVTYSFMWLPRGQNNSSATTSDSFTLAAGASVRYENVLSEVFGLSPDVSGALVISADSANLGVMSRTYNLPTAKVAGTFGQALPGVPAGDLITQNEVKRIIFMSETDDLRANLGCVNGVNDNVPIDITTYDETGAMLETQRMSLGPWSNNQINQIFADFAPTNGYADITSIKANAGYYCYGSVLDNGSNDPTSILPQ